MNLEWITDDVLNKVKRLKVLVIGDVILDRYVVGKVGRISQEAPVPVVHVSEETRKLGGAANVAVNLTAMGAKVSLAGVVGDDAPGRLVKDLLKEQKINSKNLVFDKERLTIQKTRILSAGQQIVRVDRENTNATSEKCRDKMLVLISSISSFDFVIISDYRKGLMSRLVLNKVISQCKKSSVPVFVDPKGEDFSIYKGADFITPNLKETEIASGLRIKNETSLRRAATKLLKITEAKNIIVTRGKEGASTFPAAGKSTHIKARAREVFDVTGAGDTFVSHLAIGYYLTSDVVKASNMANLASGIVVSKVGAASVSSLELLSAARKTDSLRKYKTSKELKEILRQEKSRRKKIVFTNGYFDLLHVGHIKFFHKARDLGDVLVVAINSDSSVRKIKGHPRPFIDEIERIEILSSIESIDYVTVFDEEDPIELIKTLRPDVLVKGKNIKKEQVVGGDVVQSYGGTVKMLPLFHGILTSDLIKNLNKNKKNR